MPRGSVFGLLGPNGAGKTTTLRLITGLARPTAGTVAIDGTTVETGALDVRGRVGVLDQDPRYYGWMTGRELVELAGRLQGLPKAAARTRAIETLGLVGLDDAVDRRIAGYSGGMRQRLGIAQALVAEPSLLVLDEPVSSLDPEGRRDLLALIAALRGSATVIFSTHVLADVERICDRVGILDHGRLVTEGPLTDLLARYARPLYRIEPEPGQEAPCRASRRTCVRRPGSTTSSKGRAGLTVSVTDEAVASAALLPMSSRRASGWPRSSASGHRSRTSSFAWSAGERAARGGGRLMAGFRVLLRKELLESWRTLRLPVVAGLFLVVGLTSPLLARFLPEIITAAGGDQLLRPPAPATGRRRCRHPALEEPGPVRGLRRDHPDDGLRRHGTRSRHGGVRAVQDRLARRVPRGQGRGHRSVLAVAVALAVAAAGSTPRSCSSRCRSPAGWASPSSPGSGLTAWRR